MAILSQIAPFEGFGDFFTANVQGPFQLTGDPATLSVVIMDMRTDANGWHVRVFRSGDAGLNWAEQDAAAAPPVRHAGISNVFRCCAVVTGTDDILRIVYVHTDQTLAVACFDMVHNHFLSTRFGGPTIANPAAFFPKIYACRRKTTDFIDGVPGDMFIAYTAADVIVDGLTYSRLGEVRFADVVTDFGGFSTFDSGSGSGKDYSDPQGMIVSRDDRIHVFVSARNDRQIREMQILPEETFGSPQTIVASHASDFFTQNLHAGCYDALQHIVRVPYVDDAGFIHILEATDADVPAWLDTNLGVRMYALGGGGNSSFLICAVVGADHATYVIYSSEDGTKLQQINNAGALAMGVWNAPVTIYSSTGTVCQVSARTLDNGIGIMFDEDPATLTAASGTRTMYLLLPQGAAGGGRSYSF